MRKTAILMHFMFLILFITCKIESQTVKEEEYLRHVGDIEHDALTDRDNFRTCNGDENVFQYFNLGKGPVYVGEKSTVINIFQTKYKPVFGKNQNGLIRIRFIVNCEGHAGRFRIILADSNFNETEFDEKIVSQLIEITKGIDKWVILNNDEKIAVDYYNYLIFKITDGQITEILP